MSTLIRSLVAACGFVLLSATFPLDALGWDIEAGAALVAGGLLVLHAIVNP